MFARLVFVQMPEAVRAVHLSTLQLPLLLAYVLQGVSSAPFLCLSVCVISLKVCGTALGVLRALIRLCPRGVRRIAAVEL